MDLLLLLAAMLLGLKVALPSPFLNVQGSINGVAYQCQGGQTGDLLDSSTCKGNLHGLLDVLTLVQASV
eukprot:6473833-Amphidinium_carterae.1